MLPAVSGGLRLALIVGLSTAYVTWHTRDAFAKKHDSDDSGGDDDDDDDNGGAAGGDKDDSGDEGDEEQSADDKDQPPVTAGGLFTLQTYPVNELQRPLTMTQRLTQMRLSLGTDLSAKGAFQTGGVSLEALHAISDNFMLLGGFTDAYNMKQFDVYAGFEGALMYDLIDIRVTADVHRNAIAEYANYCSPVSSTDQPNPTDPTMCGNSATAAIVNLPDGTYHAGDTQFSVNLGFPFRYAFKPEIAIVALQTLFKIDFNGVNKDHVLPNSTMVNYTDSMGNMQTETLTTYVPVGNKATPDFVPSIGLAVNPIPQLSLLAYAQLIIPDFDTSAGAFQVPVTVRVEASPNQKFDIGLAFTLLNVDPPDPQSPVDNRFLSAYVQARY